mgnify:CR=1 FL=1
MDIPFIPAHSSNYARGRTAPILWIVVHYTANDGDTDTNNAHYFQGAGRGASAHYFVDEDSITQTVRDSDTAWHCGAERGGSYFNGARNANSIGIEMCSDVVGGRYTITEQTAARTAGLVRSLMDKYNIPLSRVCRHYAAVGGFQAAAGRGGGWNDREKERAAERHSVPLRVHRKGRI